MYKDLSTVHHLISNLFDRPETAAEWAMYKLSEEQIAFFNQNGYLANIKLLDYEQINCLINELEGLLNPDHPGHHLFYEYHSNESTDLKTVLFHALGAWRITQGFHDVLWNPSLLMAASQLLGNTSVRFWHDQLFYKPAKHGGVVAWHQDYSYWTRTTPLQHLTCWIGLDDTTLDNGCLLYVPGSHKWGLLDKPELAGDMDGIMAYLSPEQKEQFNVTAIEMKKGYATFHHPLLLHGSRENNSDSPRRAFVINLFADGTTSASDEVLLNGVHPIRSGLKMEGQFFPLLFENIQHGN